MITSMWKADIKTGLLEEVTPGDYIKKELGIALKLKQDAHTLSAIKDPSQFMTDRAVKINAIAVKTADYHKLRLAELSALFLPADIAEEMALRSSARFYDDQMELLEIEMPGAYQKAFGIASIAHNTQIAKSHLSNEDAVREYKTKKKAKRFAKKQAKKQAKNQ